MVSLSQNMGQLGGGVTFFSDSLNSDRDDDPLLGSMPVLPPEPAASRWLAGEMKKTRSIRTPKAILFAKVLYVCLGLAAYLIPAFCKEGKCGEQTATSLVTYVHGGMWFILLLVHMYLRYEHRNSLMHGYFSFHLETRTLKRAPLFINTGANVVMLVMSKILDQVCHGGDSCPLMPAFRYYQILVSVEVFIALVILIVYLVKTVRFNKARDMPDFLRNSSSSQGASSQRELGFRRQWCCGGDEREVAMTLMWYEVLFWKEQQDDLCLDVVVLNYNLLGMDKQPMTPFDMQTWAMGQCWTEVYHLRHGCRNLMEVKRNLLQRLREQQAHGDNVPVN